jgi:hypothetical protein
MAVLVVALVGLALDSCVPAPRAPVDLQRAEAKVIRFGLRHPRAAICPGEPVELDVSLDVKTDDGDEMHLVPRRVDIDDAIFDPAQLYLSSPQGTFTDGVFYPSDDARVSLGTGFVMFARAPRGPAFSVRFPPYYECDPHIGGEGQTGMHGRDDAIPHVGKVSRELDKQAIAGDEVGDGVDGGSGGPGPSFTVYVTLVKTPDYTKLVAARSVGDVDMVSFAPPGYPLEVLARGGRGGDGGRGRQGVTGAGAGGQGGAGGAGGPGGNVEIVLDERFPSLESYLMIDVNGGSGGRGGSPGPGGERALETMRGRRGRVVDIRRSGPRGPAGPPGSRGPRGAIGSFVIRSAEVRPQFVGLGALVPY